MGNESEKENLDLNSIRDLASIVRDALTSIEKTIDVAERMGLNQIPVRQVPKGRKAIGGLLDFGNLLHKTVLESLMHPKPNNVFYSPMLPMVAENRTTSEKVKDNRRDDKPAS